MFRFKKASSSFLLVLKNSTISLCLRQFVNLSSQNSPISISTISFNFKKKLAFYMETSSIIPSSQKKYHLSPRGVFVYVYIYI